MVDQPSRGRKILFLVLLLCFCTVPLLGCNQEAEAEKAFRAATVDAGDLTLEEQTAALEEIANRWPKSRAARKAREELDAIREHEESQARGQALLAWDSVRTVGRAAEQYKRRQGRYPASFAAMVPDYLEGPVIDPWGNEVVYVKTDAGYQAICYGEDGLPGGTDLAKDLLVDTSRLQSD